RFLRRLNSQDGPYFRSGALGTRLPDALPENGVMVDVQRPYIDVGDWNTIVGEFSEPAEGAGEQGRTLFPSVHRIRLQADAMEAFGIKLDTATLTAQRDQPARWRLDVSSADTAGTLFWDQTDGTTQGRVDARLDRLALGEPASSEPDAPGDASNDEVES